MDRERYREINGLKLSLSEVKEKYEKEIKGDKPIPSTKALREICYYYEDIDLTKLNTKKVKQMNYLFDGLVDFNQDISNWDLSSVESYWHVNRMLSGCKIFSHDLRAWPFTYEELGLDAPQQNRRFLTHKILDYELLEIEVKDKGFFRENFNLKDIKGVAFCICKEDRGRKRDIKSNVCLDFSHDFICVPFWVTKEGLVEMDYDFFQKIGELPSIFKDTGQMKTLGRHIDKASDLNKKKKALEEKIWKMKNKILDDFGLI